MLILYHLFAVFNYHVGEAFWNIVGKGENAAFYPFPTMFFFTLLKTEIIILAT